MKRPLRKTSDCRSPLSAEAVPHATEDLFVYVYVLIHDLMLAGAIAVPSRPGPAPACTDAELLAIAVARHLPGRRSEAGFLAEVARDWSHLFPCLPQSGTSGSSAGSLTFCSVMIATPGRAEIPAGTGGRTAPPAPLGRLCLIR